LRFGKVHSFQGLDGVCQEYPSAGMMIKGETEAAQSEAARRAH